MGYATGLSPRMRGNHPTLRPTTRYHGSIPAHAGEPRAGAETPVWGGVYPRACGGTSTCDRLNVPSTGLSPRMRGNHYHEMLRYYAQGSIPAHAGEPTTNPGPSRPRRVYPRACGGTGGGGGNFWFPSGLSPRMRGNLALAS